MTVDPFAGVRAAVTAARDLALLSKGEVWVLHLRERETGVVCRTRPPTRATVAVDASVPRTLIAHSGSAAAEWVASTDTRNGCIYKAFSCQGVADGGMDPASRVDPGRLSAGDLYAASMFQHFIEGQAIRLTMVGERIFAAAIERQDELQIDWRPDQQAASIRRVTGPCGLHSWRPCESSRSRPGTLMRAV